MIAGAETKTLRTQVKVTVQLTLLVPNSEISDFSQSPTVPAVKFIALTSFATKNVSQVIIYSQCPNTAHAVLV